jgi:hypothetical protein
MVTTLTTLSLSATKSTQEPPSATSASQQQSNTRATGKIPKAALPPALRITSTAGIPHYCRLSSCLLPKVSLRRTREVPAVPTSSPSFRPLRGALPYPQYISPGKQRALLILVLLIQLLVASSSPAGYIDTHSVPQMVFIQVQATSNTKLCP